MKPGQCWWTPKDAKGAPLSHVSNALGDKLSKTLQFEEGASMLGRSFSTHAVTCLCHGLISLLDPASPRDLSTFLRCNKDAPPGWLPHPCFDQSTLPNPEARALVQEFLRIAERGGTDVRLDVGIPTWKVVHGYKWKYPAHINVLEVQAVVNSLQWRLRKTLQSNKRVLHLIDNQVCASVIPKGRTSSRRLQYAV